MLVVLRGPGFELSLASSSEVEVDFLYAQSLGFPVRLVFKRAERLGFEEAELIEMDPSLPKVRLVVYGAVS